VIAALGYVATPAGAQTPAAGSGSGGVDATGNANVTGQVGFQHSANLSPQDQMAQASVIIGRFEAGSSSISKQLGAARQARDVVKTLCLNDKLSQMDVALRSARERKDSLAVAVQRKDAELSNHEFVVLTVLKQRADQLTAEANQCIGEEAAFIGETETTTTIDPDIPAVDETGYPVTDPTLISGPPLPTSAEK
jgi:hypothetical protein